MSDTVAALGWRKSPRNGGFVVYTVSRSGWDFTVRVPGNDLCTLVASHEDGREHTERFPTLKHAKEAALALMTPAEAMSWKAVWINGKHNYMAQWGPFRFWSYEVADAGVFRAFSTDADSPLDIRVPVEGFREARKRACSVLNDHYGHSATPGAVSEAYNRISAALSVAGIQATAQQLGIVVSALDDQEGV